MKQSGKRSAGKPHAAFDEAGTGNGRYSVPRQFSTLPARWALKLFHMAEYCDTPQSKERSNREYKVCLNKNAILRLLDYPFHLGHFA